MQVTVNELSARRVFLFVWESFWNGIGLNGILNCHATRRNHLSRIVYCWCRADFVVSWNPRLPVRVFGLPRRFCLHVEMDVNHFIFKIDGGELCKSTAFQGIKHLPFQFFCCEEETARISCKEIVHHRTCESLVQLEIINTKFSWVFLTNIAYKSII